MHPVGKPMGLSLHDLQMTAEPAAYLTVTRLGLPPTVFNVAFSICSSKMADQ
jgi:hypothetical protein